MVKMFWSWALVLSDFSDTKRSYGVLHNNACVFPTCCGACPTQISLLGPCYPPLHSMCTLCSFCVYDHGPI